MKNLDFWKIQKREAAFLFIASNMCIFKYQATLNTVLSRISSKNSQQDSIFKRIESSISLPITMQKKTAHTSLYTRSKQIC